MEANQPLSPTLPSPATLPAAGALAQPPTMCRMVVYTDRRLLEPVSCPAVVCAVNGPGPYPPLMLCAFPPAHSPYPANGVQHSSIAKPGEPCWDWPVRQ